MLEEKVILAKVMQMTDPEAMRLTDSIHLTRDAGQRDNAIPEVFEFLAFAGDYL